jgi:sec-independent protein translocase protein TatB
MFDIGFTEILLIAVVAILVVGPKEFPVLMRTVGRWMGRARSVASEVRSEFHRELAKTEELARRIERETEIAELHKVVDETRTTIPLNAGPGRQAGRRNGRRPAARGRIQTRWRPQVNTRPSRRCRCSLI